MIPVELTLLILAILLLVSILASKLADRIGIPALLLFLTIGMLAGSDGPGGIYFDNAQIAQAIGVIALDIILFSGGLDTDWKSIQSVVRAGLSLALVGVLMTALVVGVAAHLFLGYSLLEGLLLGAIVSPTDAAAVFSILRNQGIGLKGRLIPLLELESGSNDPMAVFLTIGFIELLENQNLSPLALIPEFFIQMGIGALVGYGIGWISIRLMNHINLKVEGLYPVLALAIALLTYGLAGFLGGSGFLAAYLAGLVMGNAEFIHRRSLLRFFDGLAWLMQIGMFLTLGLLVFPSRLPGVILPGMLIVLVLMFIARPLGAFISLALERLSRAEKALVSWVGLRGAAPIVLATFPLLAGVPHSDTLFNLVFFVVLTSILLQGPFIPLVARWLGVARPPELKHDPPIEPNPSAVTNRRLRELFIPPESPIAGKRIVELGLPESFLIILIDRDNDFIIASGKSELQAGDKLFVISDEDIYNQVQKRISPS